MAEVQRVKELVKVMATALETYPEDYSASELLSTFATMFLSTARVILTNVPEAHSGINAILQHIQLQIMPIPTDPKKIH